jgi:ribosomal protein S18 acetylase RimI-like enzyme
MTYTHVLGSMSDTWSLRSAADSDREFLYELHETTMRGVIEQTWGWNDEWQRKDFERRFRDARFDVIESSSVPIGALCLERRPDSLCILEMQLMPHAQGRGIGTAVVQMVLNEARAQRLPVKLSVVPANRRAQRLYERLGFSVVAVEPPFIRMAHDGRAT